MDASHAEKTSRSTSETHYPSAMPAATILSSSAEGASSGGVALPAQTPSLTEGNLALLTLQVENTALLERLALSDAACKTLSSRLATSVAANKSLTAQLAAAEASTTTLKASLAVSEATTAAHEVSLATYKGELSNVHRTLSLVRKSDRKKNEHERQNFKLKALVNGHDCAKPSMEAVRTEMELREGLAGAKRRVEELEHVGRTLLDALERDSSSDTSSGEDGEEDEEEEDGRGRPGVAEAQALFWRVVEDEESAGQKKKWEAILKGKGV